MSLPSAARNKVAGANPTLPSGGTLFPKETGTGNILNFGTTGKTEHEFYTAKDFPVITDETNKLNRPYKLAVPIPFLGSVSICKLSASQGYSILTNDMHGRQKKVSNYRQDKNGNFEAEPISWVQYNYLKQKRLFNQKECSAVVNLLKDNLDGTLSIPNANDLLTGSFQKIYYGQETEMFYDMREFNDKAWGGGIAFNLDVLYIGIFPVPAFTVWPSVTFSQNQLRTAATNKVIFAAGILESVEAYDGESLVRTENIKWDKLNGQTILTSVTNDFDDLIYNYSKPAYQEYQGMGAAYRNVDLTFEVYAVRPYIGRSGWYEFSLGGNLTQSVLQPGDEIVLYHIDSLATSGPIQRVFYVGNVDGDNIFETDQSLTNVVYSCLITRSGYRNQLAVSAETISALQDPTKPGTPVTYSKTFTVPK